MSDIFITGHRNPDLDSICSAYGYSVLKNTLDKENNYIPVRCGHLSESCKKIIGALNITAPKYMPDIYPKVKDVMLTQTNFIDIDASLKEVAKDYKDTNPSVIPIYEKGKFTGLLSVDDISSWFMTHLSSMESRQDIPKIRELMRNQEEPVECNDLFDEAKASLSMSKKRGLAVFDNGEYAGYVTRRCFLKAPRYKVILVDHNEPKQSIKGIESANIVEIIDHHRLDAVKTDLPIFIDAEPLGSTCTIVHELFVRNRLVPDEYTAKVLLTGIMADTLVLKSPTTTPIDKEASEALSKICRVNVNDFGHEMFNNMESLTNADPEEAILSDFKRYVERGTNIGIGQCETTTLHDLDQYKDKFLKALEDVRQKNSLDWAVLMITNVMKENSVLLTTDYRAVKNLPYTEIEPFIFDMPGVMSRKKQLLPEMIYTL